MIVFAWLPLFSLSLMLIRLHNLLSPVVDKMQWFLKDGKDHPIIAVGYISGIIVFIIAAAWMYLLKGSDMRSLDKIGAFAFHFVA
jgi:hypothetical protein